MEHYPPHVVGSECAGCDQLLEGAHPLIESYFYQMKDRYPDLHASWVFKYVQSQFDGIDLFQMNTNGKAIFDPKFFFMCMHDSVKLGFDLWWGGSEVGGDDSHFELNYG